MERDWVITSSLLLYSPFYPPVIVGSYVSIQSLIYPTPYSWYQWGFPISVKGIQSKKFLTEDKQLCVGDKLELKKPIFYEYYGEFPKNIRFKKIQPITSYKSKRGRVSDKINDNKNAYCLVKLLPHSAPSWILSWAENLARWSQKVVLLFV